MVENIEKHIIQNGVSVRQVLSKLDKLAADAILFLVDDNQSLIGSLTDGDVRRGLIKGLELKDSINKFVVGSPKYLKKCQFNLAQIQDWRSKNYKVIPVLNKQNQIIDIINFRLQKSYLPIDAVIMAGGKGLRLRPLTLKTPKPLLKVGEKPIIEHNINHLKAYGINNITMTIKYLGQQLVNYFGDGSTKNLSINYIKEEKEPLGTIGSVSLIDKFHNDYILVMNSDLLTNINYEEMFKELLDKEADMIVATIPYEVKIPYGVIETNGERIIALKEKPTFTYYSNAGIYIFKKKFVNFIPKNKYYNATDLLEKLCKNGNKVVYYSILGYWLDIGKPNDYEKARKDIKHINF